MIEELQPKYKCRGKMEIRKISKTKLEIDMPIEFLFPLRETEESFTEKVQLWTSGVEKLLKDVLFCNYKLQLCPRCV